MTKELQVENYPKKNSSPEKNTLKVLENKKEWESWYMTFKRSLLNKSEDAQYN